MEYYNSETCLMEEFLVVKDVEYYANVEDLNTLDNLDSCLPSDNTNITISNGHEYCSSFQDYNYYSNFPMAMDMIQSFNFPISFGEFTQSHDYYSPNTNIQDFQLQDYSSTSYNDQYSMVVPNYVIPPNCKDEAVFNESKNKTAKKVPSKNLMAERRRRKRLNDRLSMLRSVVPKISKMDRTSILGDTIDYVKELLERINHLQAQEIILDNNNAAEGVMTIFKANEILARNNSPKMEVEKRGINNGETRIKISCGAGMKAGLLLSTINTLEEELGLEIQQCVISCFSDFTMQASCSHSQEFKEMDVEDIKQAVFRNIAAAGISTFV
ncbi:transcription factor bHLH93-like isoform X2 [Henckelia pumila]|uniref:transcription factor bHLH93-like isoform X2 n=1 Tax=Henckelia pumila TaxID=405737 RepID=UPI003C6E6008